MAPGEHQIDVQVWKPTSSGGLEGLSDAFIPSVPDLTALRELNVSPFLRSQIQVRNALRIV